MVSDIERKDPVGEELDMVVPGACSQVSGSCPFLVTDRQHRTAAIVLVVVWCPMHRIMVFPLPFQKGLEYIKSNTNIRDVLLSGDPLLLSDEKLAFLSPALSEISHVEFVRIGSRIPVFLPQRIPKA